MNIFNILAVDGGALCNKFSGVIQVFGYVFAFIKIGTPIMLIVVGMIDMTKAITGKDEETIKKAQKGLAKKAIAAVSVFLVTTLVGILMTVIIGNDNYKSCADCFNSPMTKCN